MPTILPEKSATNGGEVVPLAAPRPYYSSINFSMTRLAIQSRNMEPRVYLPDSAEWIHPYKRFCDMELRKWEDLENTLRTDTHRLMLLMRPTVDAINYWRRMIRFGPDYKVEGTIVQSDDVLPPMDVICYKMEPQPYNLVRKTMIEMSPIYTYEKHCVGRMEAGEKRRLRLEHLICETLDHLSEVNERIREWRYRMVHGLPSTSDVTTSWQMKWQTEKLQRVAELQALDKKMEDDLEYDINRGVIFKYLNPLSGIRRGYYFPVYGNPHY